MRLKIGEKECEFKFSIGTWRRLKKENITPMNLEERIIEDPAEVTFQLIKNTVIPKENEEPISDEYIENNTDFTILKQLLDEIRTQTPKLKDDEPKN